jgi:hypothetical protein
VLLQLQGAGAALAVDAATLVLAHLVFQVSGDMVVLLLVPAVAFGMSCSRLAQAAAVRALGDWPALFVDVNEAPI